MVYEEHIKQFYKNSLLMIFLPTLIQYPQYEHCLYFQGDYKMLWDAMNVCVCPRDLRKCIKVS